MDIYIYIYTRDQRARRARSLPSATSVFATTMLNRGVQGALGPLLGLCARAVEQSKQLVQIAMCNSSCRNQQQLWQQQVQQLGQQYVQQVEHQQAQQSGQQQVRHWGQPVQQAMQGVVDKVMGQMGDGMVQLLVDAAVDKVGWGGGQDGCGGQDGGWGGGPRGG